MANQRPGVREIFSSKTMAANSAFKFDQQEMKEQLHLSKNTAAASVSQMKKFGGYKPKILSEQSGYLEVQKSDTAASLQSGEAPRLQLTKPKPWIIGDKNTPMVLETGSDYQEHTEEINNNVEGAAENGMNYSDDQVNANDRLQSQRTMSASSETSTLIPHDSDELLGGLDNPVLCANGSVASDEPMATVDAQDSSSSSSSRTHNPLFSASAGVQAQDEDEPTGVFIPAPDYDEEERTIDFTSDDTDDPSDGGEEGKRRKETAVRLAVKVYEGADLSHYLTDDEIEQPEVELRQEGKIRNLLGRKAKTVAERPKVNDRHSLFKPAPSKSKRKNGDAVLPRFSSVRSFSYADSKLGAKGKTSGRGISFTELADDSEMFVNTSHRHSSYESFLRGRQGESILPDSADIFLGEDKTTAQQHKDQTVWKKLTLRIKNRVSRGPSVKEH